MLAPATVGAVGRKTDVLGDLEQPGGLGHRHDAPLQRPQRVEERRLHRVLCLLPRREPAHAEAEDSLRVPLVEPLRKGVWGNDCPGGWGGGIESFDRGHWTLLGREKRFPLT